MEKKVRRFEVAELDWESLGPVTIDEAIEQLDSLKARGTTHIEVNSYIRYGSDPYTDMKAYSERLESDAEFALRMEEQKGKEAWQKRQDLQQLAELRAKYGDQDKDINGLIDELGVIKT